MKHIKVHGNKQCFFITAEISADRNHKGRELEATI
jgi:hypothetical protein